MTLEKSSVAGCHCVGMCTPSVYTKANQSKDMAKILGVIVQYRELAQRTSAGESCSDRLQLASTSIKREV
jgi:hypothetical protein